MKIVEKNNKLVFSSFASDKAAMKLYKSGETVYMPPIAPQPGPELENLAVSDGTTVISEDTITIHAYTSGGTFTVTSYVPESLTLSADTFDIQATEEGWEITPATLTVSDSEFSTTYTLAFSQDEH